MQPASYGTMDVSLEWPLPTVITAFDIFGGTEIELANPKTGTHMMVLRAQFEAAIVDPTESLTLRKGKNPILSASDFLDIAVMANLQVMIPLIGAVSAALAPAGGMLFGLRPVYVSEGVRLTLAYSAPGGSQGRVKIETVTYPNTQPLTTLFNYA